MFLTAQHSGTLGPRCHRQNVDLAYQRFSVRQAGVAPTCDGNGDGVHNIAGVESCCPSAVVASAAARIGSVL